jgi:hypothetical protein
LSQVDVPGDRSLTRSDAGVLVAVVQKVQNHTLHRLRLRGQPDPIISGIKGVTRNGYLRASTFLFGSVEELRLFAVHQANDAIGALTPNLVILLHVSDVRFE